MRRSYLKVLTWLAVTGLACWLSLAHSQQPVPTIDSRWVDNFEQGLSEQLFDQGLSALRDSDFPAAEHKFLEALLSIKVNHGLSSELQFPPLKLLIQSQIAQAKWKSVDQHLGYYAWLNSKTYSVNIESYLNGIEILHQLYLAAAADVNNAESGRYLIAAKYLNWRAVSAIEATFGAASLRLPPWLYNIVLTHFYQSTLTKRKGLTSYDYKSESPGIVSGWTLPKNESLQKNYGIGLELLQRIRALYINSDSASAEIDAMILVYLGDWELLFGRVNSALNFYQQAFAGFIAAGLEQAEVNDFFDRAVALPITEFNVSRQPESQRGNNRKLTYVAWSSTFPGASNPLLQFLNSTAETSALKALATFNLTANSQQTRSPTTSTSSELGRGFKYLITNLQLLATTPDNESVRQQALQEISVLQLRPKIEDGIPVEIRNIELEYFSALSPAALTGSF